MKPVLPQNVAGWPQELLLWALSMYPPPCPRPDSSQHLSWDSRCGQNLKPIVFPSHSWVRVLHFRQQTQDFRAGLRGPNYHW